jgi:2-polyprenyl-3-methyl-5-hydroxy-6-metoxy-1,4-benzoquinol methylase
MSRGRSRTGSSSARDRSIGARSRVTVLEIIRAYDDPVVRTYCRARFAILRQRFLYEIGQYLPECGEILDVGCGFGLFSLYYAMESPRRFVRGLDVNGRRIATARHAAARLGLGNVAYELGDARDFKGVGNYAAAYMLDIVHHIPPASVAPLLAALHRCLPPGGRLLVKDVGTEPRYKRWFTWTLDRVMDPRTPVTYWPSERLQQLLESLGFVVYRHQMVDILPYPHVLYICERRA